jgi:type III secretion protein J
MRREKFGLLVLVLLALACSAPIEHGLDEAAANEIVTSLERAGISASKTRDDNGTFTLGVASGDAVAAMELLRSLGLPRGRRLGFGDIFKQGSLLPTPTEERARYVEALANGIERTLETIDGVALARVHLVLPEPDGLGMDGKARVSGQASVLLKIQAGRPAPVGEADVQKLVAGSVPGLLAASVAVVFTQTAQMPSTRGASLVPLGPLRVGPDSRTPIIIYVAITLTMIAVLAALVLILARKLAATQRPR